MREALVIAVLLALVAPAEAKYNPCRSDGALSLAPSGSMPRNAKLWLAFEEWRDVSYRVRGGGVDRIVQPRSRPDFLDLGLLAPAATYEVSVVEWGDLRIARFTTEADTDDMPPATPVIRSLAIAHPTDHEHAPGDDAALDHDAFGDQNPDLPTNELAIDLELSDDTVFLDVTVRDGTSVHHAVLWREDLRLLGRTRCGPQFHLDAGAHACVSIRAIDRAGNLGAPATRCSSVIDRPGDTKRTFVPLSRFPTSALNAPTSPLRWATMIAGLITALALVTSWFVAPPARLDRGK